MFYQLHYVYRLNTPQVKDTGNKVKKMCPVRTAKYIQHNRITMRHTQIVLYIATITV